MYFDYNKLNKARRAKEQREKHRQMSLIFMIAFTAALMLVSLFLALK